MMDERILAILKEVAYEHTDDCDGMHLECVFACGGERDYSAYTDYSRGNVDLIAHTAPCPTMLARAVLREMGMRLRVYQVGYDGITPHFRAGFNEDEVRAQYQNAKIRNLRVQYVRDL